jgi:hypothetical protein
MARVIAEDIATPLAARKAGAPAVDAESSP